MSWRPRQGQRRPLPHQSRGHSHRRRLRAGCFAGNTSRKSVARGRELHRLRNAPQRQAGGRTDCRPHQMDRPGAPLGSRARARPAPLRRPRSPGRGRSGQGLLVVSAGCRTHPARDAGWRLGADSHRCVRAGPAPRGRTGPRAAGREDRSAAARLLRPDRFAPFARAGRGVSSGRFARGLRAGRRRAARVASLRRTLGPALARPGPLRRNQ